jgi:hypothetical protein
VWLVVAVRRKPIAVDSGVLRKGYKRAKGRNGQQDLLESVHGATCFNVTATQTVKSCALICVSYMIEKGRKGRR